MDAIVADLGAVRVKLVFRWHAFRGHAVARNRPSSWYDSMLWQL
jgi:hypothetical protein